MSRLDLGGVGQRGDRPRHWATRTRPRPESGSRSTALERSSEAASVRRGRAARRCSRASTTRARTAPDGSAGEAASSNARGRGIATARSNRSRSARESFSRYAARRCAVQPHSTAGSPRPPQGHMFIVPTSWNRAETRRDHRPARLRPRRPRAVVVGTRAPSAETPAARREEARRDARAETSRTRVRTAADHRGRGCSVMWSAEGRHGYERPARRQQTCDRVDACHLEGFLARKRKNPGRRRASMVFPVPGGPASSRLCAPAAAISRARRARS